jgi:hypothetical protein
MIYVLLLVLLTSVSAQEVAPHEPGVVYYSGGSDFKPLRKEPAPASGRARFSAKLKGAHADVRYQITEYGLGILRQRGKEMRIKDL